MSDITPSEGWHINPELRASLSEVIGNLIIDLEIEAIKAKTLQKLLESSADQISRLHKHDHEH